MDSFGIPIVHFNNFLLLYFKLKYLICPFFKLLIADCKFLQDSNTADSRIAFGVFSIHFYT